MAGAQKHNHHRVDWDGASPVRQTRDPVCRMTVEPMTAKYYSDHDGNRYFFCSAGCQANFVAAPSKYLKPSAPPKRKQGVSYTCPMHPQVRRPGPGNCPICGMALEPVSAGEETGPSAELIDMTRRFWIGAALAVPLLILEMGAHFPSLNLHHYIPPQKAVWIQFILGTPVVLWAGWPFFERGWASVRNRSLNMFSLIALGVGAAYVFSLAATFAPGLFPEGLRQEGGIIPVYYEAAAVITVLVLLGQVLELRARERTGGAIRALLNLAPKTARRIRDDGTDEEVPLEQVEIGDRLRVRPGDGVPVDGEVLEGKSAVDESMVTGESMPVEKEAGAKLIGGTINGTGSLLMRAEKVGSDTVLARIVHMVAEAQRSRAPIQRLADVVSGWFVPAVIAVAVVAFVAWMIWGPPPAFAYALVAGRRQDGHADRGQTPRCRGRSRRRVRRSCSPVVGRKSGAIERTPTCSRHNRLGQAGRSAVARCHGFQLHYRQGGCRSGQQSQGGGGQLKAVQRARHLRRQPRSEG
jgi:Cu+-exporting ATPase